MLDVGCGSGRWSYGFLKLGSKVVAFDCTRSACELTKENTK
ncbi:MAG: methyltransferase domain-containing protein [Candidatus Aenigmatarchaeota archaeon]